MLTRSYPQYFLAFLCLALLVTACGGPTAPPVVSPINLQPNVNEIGIGGSATLTVTAQGENIQFNWTVNRGKLSATDTPSVIYTAPDMAGPDIVTVEVSGDGGSTVQSITLTIVEPTPTPTQTVTNTPTPTSTQTPTLTPTTTNTPTPTETPEPLDCRNALITKYVFPQLEQVDAQFPFYGPLDEPRFSCQGVYAPVRSEPVAVKIEFSQAGENFGFWGIGTPNGFDATRYREVCFWAYADKPAQNFYLQVRDKNEVEQRLLVSLENANEWTQFCKYLSDFSDLGIRLDQVENFNLGFNNDSGSATIWVDDFELK
jgi:hypothetical protein